MDLKEKEKFILEASHILKLISNPIRLCVLCNLMEGRKNVSELLTNVKISQSALSQHLQVLKKEGIIKDERENRFLYYSIKNLEVLAILEAIKCIKQKYKD